MVDRFARRIALVAGVFLVAFGLWAFLAPASFYARTATFPPYSRHLVHDIGAFMVGLGAVFVLAVAYADALLVALWGGGIGLVLHGISHIEDRALGGRSADPWLFTLAGVVVVAAAISRMRSRSA